MSFGILGEDTHCVFACVHVCFLRNDTTVSLLGMKNKHTLFSNFAQLDTTESCFQFQQYNLQSWKWH